MANTGSREVGTDLLNYLDLNNHIMEMSGAEMKETVSDIKARIAYLEEKRAGYSFLRKVLAHFDLNEPSLSTLRTRLEYYQKRLKTYEQSEAEINLVKWVFSSDTLGGPY